MSITETFLNEFCAVPGFRIEAISPKFFIITDLSVDEKDIRRIIEVRIDKDYIQIGSFSTSIMDSLLKEYVNKVIITYFEIDSVTEVSKMYIPSLSIINLAVKLNLIKSNPPKIVHKYICNGYNGKLQVEFPNENPYEIIEDLKNKLEAKDPTIIEDKTKKEMENPIVDNEFRKYKDVINDSKKEEPSDRLSSTVEAKSEYDGLITNLHSVLDNMSNFENPKAKNKEIYNEFMEKVKNIENIGDLDDEESY